MHDHDRLVSKFRQFADLVGADHDLEPERGEALALVLLAVKIVRGGAPANGLPILDTVAWALSDGDILKAATGPLGAFGFTTEAVDDEAAYDLFDAVVERHPTAAGARVALARAQECRGQLTEMEASLRTALRLDRNHRSAHEDLGALEAVRGRFRAARDNFDRAGRLPMGFAAVAANAGPGPMQAGRNEPCPCGSGARFKRCCLETDGWPLDARVHLLRARTGDWIDRLTWCRRRLPLACLVAGVDHVADDVDAVMPLVCDLAFADLHLFEHGGVERLVAEIGPVLRADERAVLDRWPGCRHEVYEVVSSSSRRTRLANTRTGEVREVFGFEPDRMEGGRALVLAVLVPGAPGIGDAWLLGGEPIPLDHAVAGEVAGLIDRGTDVVELARLVVRPTLELERSAGPERFTDDPDRLERLEWLFGDRIDIGGIRDLGDVDDLVTTLYMTGGGFSPAGDFIRWAARQLVEAEPPEVWAMAQRLTALGHDRETVLTHLACAWAVASGAGSDPDAVRAAHLTNLRTIPARAALDRGCR